MRAVTVYCASSSKVDPLYFRAASELGAGIAARGWELVYGGNDLGLMGALARGARESGGRVIGVTPQLLVDEGVADLQCAELIVTRTMRERKAIMEDRGDAFVTLPGGLGTLEEIFEIIVGRVLGVHRKPIVLLNIGRFYDPLLAMIDHGVEQRFIKASAKEAFFVSGTVERALEFLSTANRSAEAPNKGG